MCAMCTLPFHVHIVRIKNVHIVHIIFSCAHCAHKRCAQCAHNVHNVHIVHIDVHKMCSKLTLTAVGVASFSQYQPTALKILDKSLLVED